MLRRKALGDWRSHRADAAGADRPVAGQFRFQGDTVLVRRKGTAVILEPDGWPDGYVESFAGISDDFARPPQGEPEKREKLG